MGENGVLEGSAAAVPDRPLSGEVAAVVGGGLLDIHDPAALAARAKETADVLVEIIRSQPSDQPLVTTITKGGKKSEHLHLPAWQFIAQAVGVTIGSCTSEPFDDGWQAKAIVTRLDTGQVVGEGDGMCLRSEDKWAQADDYAVRSMANTRAQSRALRSVPACGMVVVLAGYSPTPAEEMQADEPAQVRTATTRAPQVKAAPREKSREPITPAQRRDFFEALRKARIYSKRPLWEALLDWWVGESKVDRCPRADFGRVLSSVAEWQAQVAKVRAIAAGETEAADKAQLDRAKRVAQRLEGVV
jgi:hypothetical protein